MLLLNILPLQSVAWAWIPSVAGLVHVIHLQNPALQAYGVRTALQQ
jgi:hypothetical protein